MGCILIGMAGFGLITVALRPLAPAALRAMDLFAWEFGEAPEPALVPVRVDSRQRR